MEGGKCKNISYYNNNYIIIMYFNTPVHVYGGGSNKKSKINKWNIINYHTLKHNINFIVQVTPLSSSILLSFCWEEATPVDKKASISCRKKNNIYLTNTIVSSRNLASSPSTTVLIKSTVFWSQWAELILTLNSSKLSNSPHVWGNS